MPIRHSLAEFKADLRAAAQAIEVKHQQMVRMLIVTLVTRLAERTPVLSPDLRGDRGRAAGSWFVSTGERGRNVVPEGGESSASEAMARVQDMTFADHYSTWYVYNNVPYIDVLEYGLYPGNGPHTVGGFSSQAPAGMLRITMAEMRETLRSLIANG